VRFSYNKILDMSLSAARLDPPCGVENFVLRFFFKSDYECGVDELKKKCVLKFIFSNIKFCIIIILFKKNSAAMLVCDKIRQAVASWVNSKPDSFSTRCTRQRSRQMPPGYIEEGKYPAIFLSNPWPAGPLRHQLL
jgi:hypothetical protein